ncbi:MAG TPA: lamin tail domain-containing protein, partial [Anaerolineales bacterium]|nr:lamin tail domain-containing protein [Anaerolineales bacterium]
KGLIATYLGDNTHASSTDGESHLVGTSNVIPTPTRRPTPLPPPPLIGLNEFVPRPGHDWNNDGVINVGDEYIELLNHGVIDVNLSGYSLDDEVNIGSNPYRLPSITLKPGERHVFYGSETGLLLSDGGDGVRLLKPNGQLEDAYNYFVVRFPDQSYCRLPDNGGLDDWNQNCFPTPGLQNSLSGSSVNPPTTGGAENLCPIADTLPPEFVLAECPPFGNNIWNPAYWDKLGWFDEKNLPESPGKWPVFAE